MNQILLSIIGILIAIGIDLRIRKIPNALTLTMIALGFFLNVWDFGWIGFQQSFLGLLAGIFLLYLPFHLGGVGGGDVKLLGAVGSLLGPVLVFKIFLASAIVGGILSLGEVIKNKSLKKTYDAFKFLIFYFFATRKFLPQAKAEIEKRGLSIPYSLAIGSGTLLVLLLFQGG